MSSSTIAETKSNFSAVLAALANGTEREHVIKNRNTPVAVIVPYGKRPGMERQFGFAAKNGKTIDWDAFDAMDAEVAEMFGM